MSRAINKITLEYLESVHTPSLNDDWVINPDLSNVNGIDKKYWKMVGDLVEPMTQEEMSIVDSLILDAPILRIFEKDEKEFVFRTYATVSKNTLYLNPGKYNIHASIIFNTKKSYQNTWFSLFVDDEQLLETEVHLNTGHKMTTETSHQIFLFEDIELEKISRVSVKGKSSTGSLIIQNVKMLAHS